MSPLSLFLVEVGICLATGAAALTSGLRRVLADACGTPQRASFWTNYSTAFGSKSPLPATHRGNGSLGSPAQGDPALERRQDILPAQRIELVERCCQVRQGSHIAPEPDHV